MPHFDPTPETALLLCIDVQERFLPAIPAIASEGACGRALDLLLRGAGLLSLPVIFSEQVPDKLGPTLPELRALAPDAAVIAKRAFSCCDDATLRDELAERGREHIVVAGIEAHICVLATVDDLLRRGYQVCVAAEAVASRRDEHRDQALAAMRDLGALVLPSESILFRLQGQADGESFRSLSRLVK